MGEFRQWRDIKIFLASESGPRCCGDQDALTLIGEMYGSDVQWVALPVARLGEDFFRLKTQMAGGFIQKFVNYGLRLVAVGDVSRYVAASESFADFVREANRGRSLWFVDSWEAFTKRLQERLL